MNLKYKILWLDDKIEELFIEDEYINEVKAYLIGKGFTPIVDTVSNEADFFAKLNDSYDLILTDYNLNEDRTRDGNKIINEVREKSIFTEILFYSAMGEVKESNRLDRITFIETNKKSGYHQEILLKELLKLIDLTIKKFQNIIAMRGMIMHETSSLDAQMIEIIIKSLNNKKISFNELACGIYEDLIKLFSNKASFVNECKEKNKFSKLTKDNFVFSANYKIQTLSQILKDLSIEDFSSDYKNEINEIRNKFAHAVLEIDDKGREYFKYKADGLIFDENLCENIRKNILKHSENLDSLENELLK